MLTRWPCPSCGTSLRAEARHAGRRTRCPKCHQEVVVPAAAVAEAELEPVEPVEQAKPGQPAPELAAQQGSGVRQSGSGAKLGAAADAASDHAEEPQPWEAVPGSVDEMPSLAELTGGSEDSGPEVDETDPGQSDAPFSMDAEIKPQKPQPATPDKRDPPAPPRRSTAASTPRGPAEAKPAPVAKPVPEAKPAEEEDIFAAIVSQSSKPAAKPAGKPAAAKPAAAAAKGKMASAAARPSAKKTGNNNKLIFIVAGSIAAVLLIGIGIMAASGIFSSPPAVVEQPPPPPQAGPPMLIVDWPKEERNQSLLILDDTMIQVAQQTGPLEYRLSPGEHKLHLRRVGSAPIDIVIPPQKEGQRFSYKPTWKPGTKADEKAILAQLDQQDSDTTTPAKKSDRPVAERLLELKKYQVDLDAAKKEAAQQKKDLLLVFFGEDNRQWCYKLAKQVLLQSDFLKFAEPKFTIVLFEAKGKTFDEGTPAAKIAAGYHITDFPAIVLADAEALPYANQDYMDPDRANYIASLRDAMKLREARDKELLPTTKGTDDEKLAAAEAFLKWASEQHVLRLYEPKIHEWIDLAERVDPHNEKGRNEAIFLTDWVFRLEEAVKQGPQQIHTVADSLEAWKKTHKFKDPNMAAQTHLRLAAMIAQAGDEEGAGKYVQEALDCNPTDQRLSHYLEQIVGSANAPISSGSGFVIADGGLILTNNHVIEGPGNVWVRISGEEKELRGTVVAADPKHDIALVKLDTMPKVPPKPMLLSGKTPGPGADIAVFGYPLGDVLGGGLKLTKGVISANPDKGRDGMYLLDCKVNHGNSGGPMCDRRGQVVGLVSAKTTVGGDTDSYGMALPPDTMANFLKANVPNFKPAPAAGGKAYGEWDEVYGAVSPSVVMILKRPS